jgi:hypothetical protein
LRALRTCFSTRGAEEGIIEIVIDPMWFARASVGPSGVVLRRLVGA